MFAIIKSGGKQYRVKKGDLIDVELLEGNHGEEIEFAEVLFFHDGHKHHVGAPSLSEVIVAGEFVEEVKGPKVTSVKYRPNHHQYRKFGHRQRYSRVRITKLGNREKSTHRHAKKETSHHGT